MSKVDRHLKLYLNDHWAGAGAGAALARRLATHNRDSVWSDSLREFAKQVESDEQALAAIRRALGVSGGDVKRVIALAGERISALKSNGGGFGKSPLSQVLEAEAMLGGVTVKRRLWSALGTCRSEDPRLAQFDFAGLERSAEKQMRLLREFQEHAAENVFSQTEL